MRVVYVAAAALINQDGNILLAQRPTGKSMAGLWEFPGGKIESGETPEAALVRELEEELAIKVTTDALKPITFASHAYEKFHLFMPLYEVKRWIGSPRPVEGQALAWVAPHDLHSYPAPAADIPLFNALIDCVRDE
ncbi:MAG: 8-oxo-dGTP diphosphatase MutT [Pseudomonadota bacterium]